MRIINAEAHKQSDFRTDGMPLEPLWRMEDRHFWYHSRNFWILEALRRYGVSPGGRVLEIGCGSGGVGRALIARGYGYVGVDTAERLIRKANERLPAADFVCGRVEDLPASFERSFDAIGFFDVLEHLSEPGKMLEASLRFARPGARIFATVPAQQALFSIMDEIAEHKKRYDLGDLKSLFLAGGLSDVHEHGIFRLLVGPLRQARRQLQKKFPPPLSTERLRALLEQDTRIPGWPMNQALRILCALECKLGFAMAEDRLGSSQLVVGAARGA